MKIRFACVCLLLLSRALPVLGEDKIGFIEKFALAPDREAALGELLPGSEEFYYFHAIHYQNSGQKEKLHAIMGQWAARYPGSDQRRILENREALLGFETDPKASARYLEKQLAPDWNHPRERRAQKPDLPSALDPKQIAREIFEREAIQGSDDLRLLDTAALERMTREKAPLTPSQRRALLSRITRPDRVWAYAKNLGPVFRTLKGQILYQRLCHDRTRGIHDRARLWEYLRLPRRTAYARQENRAERNWIDFTADLSDALKNATPIGDDQWLVRESLLEILKNEPAWEPFAVYLREDYLKAIYAESKIVHGIGAPEKMLTVLDENRRPVADAAAWVEGRRFTADPQTGRIGVPFTQQPGLKPIVLADAAGEFATLTQKDSPANGTSARVFRLTDDS